MLENQSTAWFVSSVSILLPKFIVRIFYAVEWKQFLMLHYVKAVAIFWALLGSLTPFGVGVHRNARNPNKLIYCISLSRGSYLWWPEHTKSPFLLTLYYSQRKLLLFYWCSKKFYKMHSLHFIFGIIVCTQYIILSDIDLQHLNYLIWSFWSSSFNFKATENFFAQNFTEFHLRYEKSKEGAIFQKAASWTEVIYNEGLYNRV